MSSYIWEASQIIKSEVQIYDYVDVHVGVLERMYHKRIKGYASIGYSAKSDSRPFEATNAIFDNHNFITVFRNDISSAKSEMVIVSPYMTPYCFVRLNATTFIQ